MGYGVPKDLRHYEYKGSVMVFNDVVESGWRGYTQAVSPEKAKSNLMYRYKVKAGMSPDAHVYLPDEVCDVTDL